MRLYSWRSSQADGYLLEQKKAALVPQGTGRRESENLGDELWIQE